MVDSLLISAIINGIALGAIYALISIGLNIIFGVMDFVNFAHGEYIMLSMYGTYFLYQFTGVNPLLLLVVMVPVMFVVGVITQRVVFQPVLDAPGTMQIFLSLGLLLVLQNAAQIIFGVETRSLNIPWASQTFSVLGTNITYPRVAAIVLAVLTTLALFGFLRYTHLGRVIRATAQSEEGAELMGVDSKRVYLVTFGLGLALVGVASAPLTMIYFITPTIGVQFVLIAFVVVVLGGLGNLKGALYAGFFIGLLEAVVSLYLSSEIAAAIYFTLFICVLYVRSQYGALWDIVSSPSSGGVSR